MAKRTPHASPQKHVPESKSPTVPPQDEDWEEECAYAEDREKEREEEEDYDRALEIHKLSCMENPDLADYQGDEYFISEYTQAPFSQPLEATVAEVQSVEFLCYAIRFGGLEYILSDKYATAGLRKELLARNLLVIRALKSYGKKRDTGGRNPKLVEGIPMGDKIVEQTKSKVKTKVIALRTQTTPGSVRSQQSQARKKGKLPPLP